MSMNVPFLYFWYHVLSWIIQYNFWEHNVINIADILKSHHDECMKMKDERDYVAISHVRDMLIPIQERKRLQPLWDKAVKFLSANESRVKVETQTIAGEVYAVWRWLHTSANGNKVWQGQGMLCLF